MGTGKKVIFIIMLLCLSVFSVHAQGKPILAVTTIESAGVSEALASTCRNMVETALIQTELYSVLSYTDIEEILEAQAFSLSGCTDDSCAIEIGKLLAAEKIVLGELAELGDGMILTIRLIDVTTGTGEKADMVNISGPEEMQDMVFKAAYGIAGMQYTPAAGPAGQGTGSIYITAPGDMVLNVKLDDKPVGQTPVLIGEIGFGTHSLTAETEGYRYERELFINSSELLEIIADTADLKGNLHISIRTAGAEGYTLLLNEQETEPGLLKNIAAGEYRISVSGNGWFYENTLTVEPDGTTSEVIDLIECGSLSVTFPDGGRAELTDAEGNSLVLGNGLDASVAAGEYKLMISHSDYRPYSETIRVNQGDEIKLVPVLKHTDGFLLSELQQEREQTRNTRKIITIGAVSTAGLAIISGGLTLTFELLVQNRVDELAVNYTGYENTLLTSEAVQLRELMIQNTTDIETFRAVRNGMLISFGVNTLASVLLFILNPSTAELDSQIMEIEGRLQ